MYTDTDLMFLYIEYPNEYAKIRDTEYSQRVFELSKVPETNPCPSLLILK